MSPARHMWGSVAEHPWMQNALAVVMILGAVLALYGSVAAARLPARICKTQNDQTQALLTLIKRSTKQGARIRTPQEQHRAEAFYRDAKRTLEHVDCQTGWWP